MVDREQHQRHRIGDPSRKVEIQFRKALSDKSATLTSNRTLSAGMCRSSSVARRSFVRSTARLSLIDDDDNYVTDPVVATFLARAITHEYSKEFRLTPSASKNKQRSFQQNQNSFSSVGQGDGQRFKRTLSRAKSSVLQRIVDEVGLSVEEFRLVFISMLRSAYEQQINNGELANQHFLTVILQQSLENATVQASKSLTDWEYIISMVVDPAATASHQPLLLMREAAERIRSMCGFWPTNAGGKVNDCTDNETGEHRNDGNDSRQRSSKEASKALCIEGCLAFMAAHRAAQKLFLSEFQSDDNHNDNNGGNGSIHGLSAAAKVVLKESRSLYAQANEYLNEKFDRRQVQAIVSYKFCTILLSKGIRHIEEMVHTFGLLKEDEAEHLIETLEEQLDAVEECCEGGFDYQHSHSRSSDSEDGNENDSGSNSDSDSELEEGRVGDGRKSRIYDDDDDDDDDDSNAIDMDSMDGTIHEEEESEEGYNTDAENSASMLSATHENATTVEDV